jgi:hypothetical protein
MSGPGETDIARILREANQPLQQLRVVEKELAELKAAIRALAASEENPHVGRRLLMLIGEAP